MMRFSFSGLFRATILLSLAACTIAIGVGRLAPRPADHRLLTATRIAAISGYNLALTEHAPRLVERDDGRFLPFAFPDDTRVECISFSPWQDLDGNTFGVGRWIARSETPGVCAGFGLVRFAVPGWKVIDRLATDILPTGGACFFPESRTRILFTGGDGGLYHASFGLERDSGVSPAATPPTRLVWKTPEPGEGGAALCDPLWPTDSQLKGRLIVTLSHLERTDELPAYSRSELWWLKLSADGSAIVEAGRLIRRNRLFPPDLEVERFSAVGQTPDGRLALAYLGRRAGNSALELRLAPLNVEPATGIPWIDPSRIQRLAGPCTADAPTFSTDGRWVFAITEPRPSPTRAARFSVIEKLGISDAATSGLAFEARRGSWE